MKYSIDITGDSSLCVDTDGAFIFGMPPRALEPVLCMDFWGLVFVKDRIGNTDVPRGLPNTDANVIVAGWARMSFSNPLSITFNVALYDESGRAFRCGNEGEVLCLSRTVVGPLSQERYCYELGGHLLWPNGNAEISVAAAGRVTVEFAFDDWMTTDEFERRRDEVVFPS
jgi:hypothetical protein